MHVVGKVARQTALSIHKHMTLHECVNRPFGLIRSSAQPIAKADRLQLVDYFENTTVELFETAVQRVRVRRCQTKK